MAEPQQRIQELKTTLEKIHGREISSEEASNCLRSLKNLAQLLYDSWIEETKLKQKLERFPEGFLHNEDYPCRICGHQGRWYDKWEFKCMVCQEAVNRKVIPASIAKDRDAWYSTCDLATCFNLKGKSLNSWIKKGILKERIITTDDKKVHLRLFLIKDNKGFLPPKKLVESRSITEKRDGYIWFRSEPWYRFVDPHEHLKGYKIMDYIKVIPLEDQA